jgi:hypothetical protein
VQRDIQTDRHFLLLICSQCVHKYKQKKFKYILIIIIIISIIIIIIMVISTGQLYNVFVALQSAIL